MSFNIVCLKKTPSLSIGQLNLQKERKIRTLFTPLKWEKTLRKSNAINANPQNYSSYKKLRKALDED